MPTDTKSYEPFTTTVDPADAEFDTWTLTAARASDGRGWSVTGDEGWSCFLPDFGDHPAPQVGDTLVIYGSIGRPIQGQVLNGHVLWYRTPEQREVRRENELAQIRAVREAEFVRDRDKLDAKYDALPAVFKARIDRFRAEDPDFRVESEAYEAFILQQAALLAEHFQTADAVKAWADIKAYDEQQAAAPEGWSDDHSGNTYGCSVRFALALLRGESL